MFKAREKISAQLNIMSWGWGQLGTENLIYTWNEMDFIRDHEKDGTRLKKTTQFTQYWTWLHARLNKTTQFTIHVIEQDCTIYTWLNKTAQFIQDWTRLHNLRKTEHDCSHDRTRLHNLYKIEQDTARLNKTEKDETSKTKQARLNKQLIHQLL